MFLKIIDAFIGSEKKEENPPVQPPKPAEGTGTPPAIENTKIPAEAGRIPAQPAFPGEKPESIGTFGAMPFFLWLKSLDGRYVFGAALFFLVLALAAYSKAIIVVPVFIVLAACSRYLQLGFPFVIGIDLCLFFTVLAALAYGPLAGVIVGTGSALLGIVVKNTRNPEEKLAFYLGMALIGYLAPHLPFGSVYASGLAATIIYDAIVVYGYFYLVRKCIVNAFSFASTHLLFNMWLFSRFGEGLLGWIK